MHAVNKSAVKGEQHECRSHTVCAISHCSSDTGKLLCAMVMSSMAFMNAWSSRTPCLLSSHSCQMAASVCCGSRDLGNRSFDSAPVTLPSPSAYHFELSGRLLFLPMPRDMLSRCHSQEGKLTNRREQYEIKFGLLQYVRYKAAVA
jgi:hypothetical protein